MGLRDKLSGWTESTKFDTVEADRELFEQLKDQLPSEPMVRLRPRKDSPGLDHGPGLVRNLYHYRTNKVGSNVSPVNSFEIWYENGEVRFYFHPDTHEQRTSAKKQFEDSYPGTQIREEEESPIPQMDQGDYVAGGQMTLTNHFALPMKRPTGQESFKRDPFGPLTSEMVVEGERVPGGERVRPEDVRMVVQVLFKPVSRNWSEGGLFGTDVYDYADDMKQSELKGSTWQQIAQEFVGEEPKERDISRKEKKAADIVTEQRGQPAFICRLRVVCISPHEEVARQHVGGVCEVFETYYNPITEQGFESRPLSGDSLRSMLGRLAGRELSVSRLEKLGAAKDVLTVPELAGVVHLPNENVKTPNIDWTQMQKGAGVPSSSPDLQDVSEEIEAASPAGAEQETEEQEEQDRMQNFDIKDVEAEEDDTFNLEIDTEGYEETSGPETTTDGRGMATDQALSDAKDDGQTEETEPMDPGPDAQEGSSNDGGPDSVESPREEDVDDDGVEPFTDPSTGPADEDPESPSAIDENATEQWWEEPDEAGVLSGEDSAGSNESEKSEASEGDSSAEEGDQQKEGEAVDEEQSDHDDEDQEDEGAVMTQDDLPEAVLDDIDGGED